MTFRRPGLKYLLPQPCWASTDRISRFANAVREKAEFEIGALVSQVVNRFGGELHMLSVEELAQEDGAIYVHDRCDFDIIIPDFTSPKRDQFTIAHELGHYFLHSLQGQRRIVAARVVSGRRGRAEWEANWFAASLLMPEVEFRDAVQEDPDAVTLAARFGVSAEAAEVRRNILAEA